MAKLTICRTNIQLPTGGVLDGIRDFLFRAFDGVTDHDKKAWHRF
jgi:hypothetical protein